MSAAVTRTLSITYAGVEVGGTTEYLIHGKVRFENSYTRFAVRFQVLVQNDTAATFKSACAALEAAYRTPRGRLTIAMEGQTFHDFNPATNSGFLAAPSIAKSGDQADTGRSRLYDVAVELQQPADLSGQAGRLDSTIDFSRDASVRRRIVISGVYTALAGASARAQYDASIGAYATSVLGALASGATIDLVDEVARPDDADKNCAFSRTYQEVLYAATSGGLAHASIRNAAIVFRRRRPAPGDHPGKSVKRLEEGSVSFACNVDRSVSTSLETLYEQQIRPYLLDQAKSIFSASVVVTFDETRGFDKSANAISAELDLRMVIGGSATLAFSREITVENEHGEELQPAWAGDRHAKYQHDGIARRVRTTTEIERRTGLWAVSDDGLSFNSGGAAGAGGGAGGGGAGQGQGPAASSGAGQGGSFPSTAANHRQKNAQYRRV